MPKCQNWAPVLLRIATQETYMRVFRRFVPSVLKTYRWQLNYRNSLARPKSSIFTMRSASPSHIEIYSPVSKSR